MSRISTRFAAFAIALAIAGCAPGTGAGPTAAPRTAVPSPTAVPPSLPADFPLGVWKVTITQQDLSAQGVQGELLLNENSGTFTKTYRADGSWEVVQVSDVPLQWPVYRGTFAINAANELAETTEFPSSFAGEVLRYTWAREGAGVRFDILNPPDPMVTIITETFPWLPA